MLGTFGLLIALARTIYYLFRGGNGTVNIIPESNSQKVLLITGCILLTLGGIFPNVFLLGYINLPPLF
jgi:hypothetical protein